MALQTFGETYRSGNSVAAEAGLCMYNFLETCVQYVCVCVCALHSSTTI